MSEFKRPQQIGGLVLSRAELESVLKEPGTTGLAFAVHTPGEAKDVDLKLLRVYERGGTLHGEDWELKFKKGARSPLRYPATRVQDFKFKHLKKLQSDKFSFGYFSKDQFQMLFSNGFDQVFIGGGINDYGNIDIIDGSQSSWFTLSICVRRSLKSIIRNSGPTLNRKAQAPSSNGNGVYKLSFGDFEGKGSISADELRSMAPKLFSSDPMVASVIVGQAEYGVEGFTLSTPDGVKEVIFDSDSSVEKILIDLDGRIKRIDLREIQEEEDENSPEAEEGIFIGSPLLGHFEPCPPDWYNKNGKTEENYKSIIKTFLK